jgi:WD40 repeat protein/serine/threonine protein kinase
MTAPPRSLKELFLAALEVAPEDRAAWLERGCAVDAGLREHLRLMLAAHDAPQSLLDGPAQSLAAILPDEGVGPSVAQPLVEGPGTVIGPYKLLEQIGEGGFGIVFMAEQQHPVRRKVALKVVKPGMDSKQIIARFEAERQALALMDHQNIAHVLDAGTTDSGRPYFVMELVRGVPITQLCDDNQLMLSERLELFVAVCQAVQHAHQKGIIHRDLKPSNVLVTLDDGTPLVKVIDFGIAKALGQERLTDKTLFTSFAQMLGTPLYMSPEQAEMSRQEADTRSDIYSLGVLLYELLTGTTPFDKERLKEASFDEIRRIIREDEPAKPSTRISTLGQAATTVSANRKSEPRRLSQLFRGELDWIVMKALEKDRNRRYESASAFAADVQRYLHDETVQACPPSAWYRIRKFVRHNKKALVISALIGVMLLGAVAAVVASALWAAAQAEAGTRVVAAANDGLATANDRLERTLYYHRIALAHRELTANQPNPAKAEELLDACPPERRGWEWHYLKRLWRVEPVVLRAPGNKEISGVAFSPDGEHLAAACLDRSVKVWHLRSREVITLRGHEKYVRSLAFSPTNGRRIATGSADKTVRIWDLRTRQEVRRLLGTEGMEYGMAQSVTFSPDGRWLAAASEKGTVRVWDAASGEVRHTLSGHGVTASCVTFSPDGQLLASGDWYGIVQIWDAQTGRHIHALREHIHPVGALAFSPGGGCLAAGYFDRLIAVWDPRTGDRLDTLAGHIGLVLGLAFSPDGSRLASTSQDRSVRIWDLSTGQEVLQLRGHTDWCQGLAFHPNGRLLASASKDGTIRLWDATPATGNEGQEVFTFRDHAGEVWSVAVSPDGTRVASAGGIDPILHVWDARTGDITRTFSDMKMVIFSVAFSFDGRLAAAGNDAVGPKPYVVKVWDTQTGQNALTFRESQPIFYIAFSPDGRWLALGIKDGAVKLWDTRTGQAIGLVGKHHGEVRGLMFRHDGKRLASASRDGTVKIWDVTRAWFPVHGLWPHAGCTALVPLSAGVQMLMAWWMETNGPQPLLTIPGDAGYLCVTYSPDGRRLLTVCGHGQLTLREAETGQPVHTVGGQWSGQAGGSSAVFSPDGRWVASSAEDCTVKVWESATLVQKHSFRGHTAPSQSLAFSPDGRRLVSAGRDRTVKVWDLTHLDKK